jgi:hypothetical protein
VRDLGYRNERGYWYNFDEDDLEARPLRGDVNVVDLFNILERNN